MKNPICLSDPIDLCSADMSLLPTLMHRMLIVPVICDLSGYITS